PPATSSPLFPYTTLFRSVPIPWLESALPARSARRGPIDRVHLEIRRHRDLAGGLRSDRRRGERKTLLATAIAERRSLASSEVETDRKSTRLNSSHQIISY